MQLWDYYAKIYDVFIAYFLSSGIILTKLNLLGYAYKALVAWFQHVLFKNVPVCLSCLRAQGRFCLSIHVNTIYLCIYCCILKMETTALNWSSEQEPGMSARYARDLLKSYFPNMEGSSSRLFAHSLQITNKAECWNDCRNTNVLSGASCMGKLAVVATEIQPCNIGRSDPKESLRYL